MDNRKKILAIISTTVIAVFIAWTIFFSFSDSEKDLQTDSLYEDELLGIGFDVPDGRVITGESGHGLWYLKLDDMTVLSAASGPYTGPDRGAGWVDLSYAMAEVGTVSGFCEEPFAIRSIEADDLLSCEAQVNDQGIAYIKTYQEVISEGSVGELAYFYYLEPLDVDGPFIVLSTDSLEYSGVSTKDAESELDHLVDSIYLLQ